MSSYTKYVFEAFHSPGTRDLQVLRVPLVQQNVGCRDYNLGYGNLAFYKVDSILHEHDVYDDVTQMRGQFCVCIELNNIRRECTSQHWCETPEILSGKMRLSGIKPHAKQKTD